MLKTLQLMWKIVFSPRSVYQEIKENPSIKYGIYSFILWFGIIEIIGLITGTDNAIVLLIFWFILLVVIILVGFFVCRGLSPLIKKILRVKDDDKSQNKAAVEISLFNAAMSVSLASLTFFPAQEEQLILGLGILILLIFWFIFLELLAAKILYSEEHSKIYLKTGLLFVALFSVFLFLTVPNFFHGNIWEKIITRGLSVVIALFWILLNWKLSDVEKFRKKFISSFLTFLRIAVIFVLMYLVNNFIMVGIFFTNFCMPREVEIGQNGSVYVSGFGGIYEVNKLGKWKKKLKTRGYFLGNFIVLDNGN
ncbi:MAG: hypothetical protein Q7K21_05990, partial [Elusimicrobiota bacterium]|nr:hypothetical protein [Elusimicrobiota bacterium]